MNGTPQQPNQNRADAPSLDRDRLIGWLAEGLITHDEFESLLRGQPSAGTYAETSTPASASSPVRYDLSGLDAFERSLIRNHLSELDVAHQLADDVLTVAAIHEGTVDHVIDEVERHSAELKAAAEHRAKIARGELPPTCELCGRSPAAPITLRRQVGMVVVMSTHTVEAVLCEDCARQAHKDYQIQTAIKGWTGVKSALFNPVVIATNANNKRKHHRTIHKDNAPKAPEVRVKPPLTAAEQALLDGIMGDQQLKPKPQLTVGEQAFLNGIMGDQHTTAEPRRSTSARVKRTPSEQAFLDEIMNGR